MTLFVFYSVLHSVLWASSFAAGYVESGVSTGDAAPRFEPQVAMVCAGRSQYHAQYMTKTGRWVTDEDSKVTCLKDKVDILRYCKQVYADRDITNIVESSHYYKVPNFCRLGHSKCKASAWVKPYRCLEGSFQSDALLVPEGCLFDHIHNQSRCWEFDRWNTTADHACAARRMTLKSFAMLLPCGIDVFSGVEFVCCPKNYKNHGKARPMEVEEPVALPQMDRHAHQSLSPPTPTPTPRIPTTTTPQEVGARDEYFSRFDPHEEHDAFRRAEQRLEERHREKVSKIMKEWSDLEERYQDLRAKDPHSAEEFKHRMTQRFQQTVEAVEAENEAERHQLTALHQQRIVAHINEMKREAMTCYTRALNEKQPNTHRVQKCLQKLLRALNKDRHHTVSHYKHLLNSDYEAADRERDSTLQHLSDLERMVNQSLNMPEEPEFSSMTQASQSQESDSESVSQDPVELDTPTADSGLRAASSSPNASTPNASVRPEPLLVHHTDDVQVANVQHHPLSHQASYSVMRETSGSESRGVYFTLAFAGVALMMAMVVGIVVLRRRNSTNPHSQGFMEVDQAITPEERHVANMQVNGYENPTYKYFEEK